MYRIFIKNKAEKEIASLPPAVADRIAAAIDGLAENPRQMGSKKLQGYANVFRIRVGDYRIVYSIEDAVLTVEVIKIGHRQSIYKN
ncbi:MAG: type II toxin-antitoxin system RelE/ParE family toxin [Planctomycetaceae bacterium]|jgi:mRNA interferase RelE/StbE|nr:type II toxin-antitoxin system RelE/ParE family toxin [Planctomycetaceae bacterium]